MQSNIIRLCDLSELEHSVCRDRQCQSGKSGAFCGQTSDYVVQTGLTPPHAVCRQGNVNSEYCRIYKIIY